MLVTLYMKTDVDVQAKREFIFACNEIRDKIDDRLQAHKTILLAGAALFDASDQVTREQWRTFTQRLNVESNLTGIQGIGFALRIPPDGLAQHVQEIRSEGFPNYNVRPEGDRGDYSSIIYLEPFLGRNPRAFGYDMLSEPVRRAALERARDQNKPTLSGKVILVQETEKDIQAGTLMYVPVYRRGMPTGTVEQRRDALFGWVYSPYRMTDLMRGTLGGWDTQEGLRIRLQLYDGTRLSPDTILYDSQTAKDMGQAPQFTEELQVIFNGSPWTLRFNQVGGMVSLVGYAKVWLTLAGGMIISFLLFGLTLSLLNTRFNAGQMADRLTAELRETEERWQFALEGARDGVWDWNAQTNEVFFSRRWSAMLGYEEHEIGNNFDEYQKRLHPDEVEKSYAALERHLTGETPFYETEHRMRCKDRAYKWISARGKVMQWTDDGQPQRVIGTHTDITERKRLEEERLDIQHKLLQAQKIQGFAVMAGGIAHDFNNSLMAVLGNLEFALTDRNLEPKTHRHIESAIQASQRLAVISRQMQIYSSGGLYISKDFDLNELAHENEDMLKSVITKTTTLSFKMNKGLPFIRGDEDQIQRVIANLIINASESLGDNTGEVTLRTGVMDCDAAYLSSSRLEEKPEPGLFVFLEVTDNGCGMNAETQRKLLEPYFSTKFWGRGMGMAEVMGIVNGLHGAIIVESQVGKGTTVRVLFPASEKTQTLSVQLIDAVETAPPLSDSVGRRKTILVVDDEELVRGMVLMRLEILGYDTIPAADGEEGVRMFRDRSKEIDLVLLDFIMPKMNGIEVFAELIQIRPDVKVIISSGYTEDVVIAKLPGRRPESFLQKPYKLEVLKNELERLLRRAG